jgi:hypothetical protein
MLATTAYALMMIIATSQGFENHYTQVTGLTLSQCESERERHEADIARSQNMRFSCEQ